MNLYDSIITTVLDEDGIFLVGDDISNISADCAFARIVGDASWHG